MNSLNIGDKIKCKNGHVVCEVMRPLFTGDILQASYFKFTKKQKQRATGDLVGVCFCGALIEFNAKKPEKSKPL